MSRVVDKHHDWVLERIKDWKDHVEQSKNVLNDAIDPGKKQPYEQTVRSLITLSLDCYDKAFGWIYPTGRQ
jgi:hypothetical protein